MDGMHMAAIPLLIVLVAGTVSHVECKAVGKFKAGALNQLLVQEWNAHSREDALKAINGNIATMEIYAQVAKKQGVNVLVFPEYGINGWMDGDHLGRDNAYPYMEQVPTPGNGSCSLNCSQAPATRTEAQTQVACIAKKFDMYISANMVEQVLCQRSQDTNCPPDNHYQYNTNIIYNRQGCLVAKYHKAHLVEEEPHRLDAPHTPEHVYFDTEYGRFGTMICADGMYMEPGTSLVEKYHIDHLIYPMAWDVGMAYVYMGSIEWQYAVAARYNVSVIAANVHDSKTTDEGSGIYHNEKLDSFIFNPRLQANTLLTADIPIANKTEVNRNKSPRHHRVSAKEKERRSHKLRLLRETTPPPDGIVHIYGDRYYARILNGTSGAANICYKDFCCSLNFTRNNTDDMFILGAFRGAHTLEEFIIFENCVVYKCAAHNLQSCSVFQSHSETAFSSFYLHATFTTYYVLPSVYPSGFAFDKVPWKFDRQRSPENSLNSTSDWPLVAASLVGVLS